MAVKWDTLAKSCLVKPGKSVTLAKDFDSGARPHDVDKSDGVAQLDEAKSRLFDLQDRFYAQSDRALLIVLQAIDAAGKDSTIKHVMGGLNPQGVDVFSFKAPSNLERAHDFLWRHQVVAPELGRIAVFNRSHYENVTVTRVHPELLWPKSEVLRREGIWKRRFEQINEWERYLADNGTAVVKIFLNVSKKEQGRRFLARIDQPEKNWKFSPDDLAERGYWDDYQDAFNEMLSHTSTEVAPWYVVPADHKWFSRLCTFSVLLTTLTALNPEYPTVSGETKGTLAQARASLESETA